MLIQMPALDFMDLFHVAGHVVPRQVLIANDAQKLGKFRRPLALVFSVAAVIVVVAGRAVVTSCLVVLHPGHCGEQLSAIHARVLKEMIDTLVKTREMNKMKLRNSTHALKIPRV